jgi:hypothetical protein
MNHVVEKESATGRRIAIPIVIGKNRLRGTSTGAMVDDESGDNLGTLRAVLANEARAAGVEPDKTWMSNAVSQVLRLYEDAHADWKASNDGTIGFVYEAGLPSGQSLLLGDARALRRINKEFA